MHMPPQPTLTVELSAPLKYCYVCTKATKSLVCAGQDCDNVAHYKCASAAGKKPEGDWLCMKCMDTYESEEEAEDVPPPKRPKSGDDGDTGGKEMQAEVLLRAELGKMRSAQRQEHAERISSDEK
jgi:hypothetical protein